MQLRFTRSQLRMMLGVMLTMDAVVIALLIGLLASPWLGVVMGITTLLLPIAIFQMVIPTIAGALGWWTLRRLYPPVGTPAFDDKAPMTSVGLRSQLVRLDNVIETVQDDTHLHLRIMNLIGPSLMPVSIPWAAMRSITVPRTGVARVDLEQGPRLWLREDVMRREIDLRKELEQFEPAETSEEP